MGGGSGGGSIRMYMCKRSGARGAALQQPQGGAGYQSTAAGMAGPPPAGPLPLPRAGPAAALTGGWRTRCPAPRQWSLHHPCSARTASHRRLPHCCCCCPRRCCWRQEGRPLRAAAAASRNRPYCQTVPAHESAGQNGGPACLLKSGGAGLHAPCVLCCAACQFLSSCSVSCSRSHLW